LSLKAIITNTEARLSEKNIQINCSYLCNSRTDNKRKKSLAVKPFYRFFFLAIFALFFFKSENQCFSQELKGVTPYDTTLANLHSPRKASFYSAVLPGLGQIYNHKYWKVPIIYAGLFALFKALQWNNDNYLNFKKAYIYRTDNDPNTSFEFPYGGSSTARLQDNQLLDGMDYHKRYRDLSIFGIAGFYILNIIDATVDAYLFDYDVSQKLTLKVKPALIESPFSVNLGLTCSLRF
jgi:hypothetical protein